MTTEQLIEKYKNKVYTQNGMFNLRTFRAIVKHIEPGIPSAEVFFEPGTSHLIIYFEGYEPRGAGPEKEIEGIIHTVEWIKKQWFSDAR